MAAQFIPAGRTSLVKAGGLSLQVQTEYAPNPTPRITTTILRDGRVVQKIERALDKPVTTLEEQTRMERSIQRQHHEVCRLLERGGQQTRRMTATSEAKPTPPTTHEQLQAVPGVQRVFRLDNEGNFVGAAPSEEFRKMFAPVFQNLRELLDVFMLVPGVGVTRETGVYEVERDALYLVSAGVECYILLVEPPGPTEGFEQAFKRIISPLG